MVFFITRVGGGHTGIVIGNDNGLLETIEGNTNNNGSAEGIGVFRRTKRRTNDSNVLGFASYDNAPAAVAPVVPLGFVAQPAVGPMVAPLAAAAGLNASNWVYQLQAIKPSEIAGSEAEFAVIDNMSGIDDENARFFTATEVTAMGRRPSGGEKTLVSYLSIGEAEIYRPYWNANWVHNPPSWLDAKGGLNEQWDGNIKVRYWLTEWKRIIFGSADASLDRIIAAGFNGAYLDIVDGFEFWELPENAARTEAQVNPRGEMIKFVLELAAYARARRPGFLIIPQNGESLLRSPEYLSAINGIGIESLLYTGNGMNLTTDQSRTERIADIGFATATNRPVFAIEYVKHSARVKNATAKLSELGYIPYFGPKLLDELRSPWNVVA
jgi:cysteinyl-tRNA synthetase, unknown class